MHQTDTKTRILNTAEHLFGRDGFHNTSLRALTNLAKVNLAAVNYHFGSKETLLQAVIERRLRPLNKLRQEKIEAVLAFAQQTATAPSATALLRAFIEPTLAFRSTGPGAEDFIALIGRSLTEPDQTVRTCLIKQFLPIFTLLFNSLRLALPELPGDILLARLQFTMGALSQVMCNSIRPALQLPGFPEPLAGQELVEQLLTFVSAGLKT